jgi:hypothetical protein
MLNKHYGTLTIEVTAKSRLLAFYRVARVNTLSSVVKVLQIA